MNANRAMARTVVGANGARYFVTEHNKRYAPHTKTKRGWWICDPCGPVRAYSPGKGGWIPAHARAPQQAAPKRPAPQQPARPQPARAAAMPATRPATPPHVPPQACPAAPPQAQQAAKPKRRRNRPTLFTILLDIELVIAIVLACALVLPRVFGVVPDVVQSGSMEPTIPVGAIVYTDTKVSGNSLKEGDIAVYKATADTSVMHRVHGKSGMSYVFKGDANMDADKGTVSPNQIEAKYLFHVPLAGYAYAFFDTYRITAFAAIAAINFLALALHISKRRKMRKAQSAAPPSAPCRA